MRWEFIWQYYITMCRIFKTNKPSQAKPSPAPPPPIPKRKEKKLTHLDGILAIHSEGSFLDLPKQSRSDGSPSIFPLVWTYTSSINLISAVLSAASSIPFHSIPFPEFEFESNRMVWRDRSEDVNEWMNSSSFQTQYNTNRSLKFKSSLRSWSRRQTSRTGPYSTLVRPTMSMSFRSDICLFVLRASFLLVCVSQTLLLSCLDSTCIVWHDQLVRGFFGVFFLSALRSGVATATPGPSYRPPIVLFSPSNRIKSNEWMNESIHQGLPQFVSCMLFGMDKVKVCAK